LTIQEELVFEDHHVELLPARTTMQTVTVSGTGGAGATGGYGDDREHIRRKPRLCRPCHRR